MLDTTQRLRWTRSLLVVLVGKARRVELLQQRHAAALFRSLQVIMCRMLGRRTRRRIMLIKCHGKGSVKKCIVYMHTISAPMSMPRRISATSSTRKTHAALARSL
tara:strand:+ start:264 stop:578 length:315 start_codon:yes stop_codon:yes gene_type:complete